MNFIKKFSTLKNKLNKRETKAQPPKPITPAKLSLAEKISAPPGGYSPFTQLAVALDRNIRGYSNYDDFLCFKTILELQSALGVHGDFLEIGTFKGKMAAILASGLKEGERLFISDLFDEIVSGMNDFYGIPLTMEEVRKNIEGTLNKRLGEQLVFMKGLSSNLQFPEDQRFRFIHIDGGHTFDCCYRDLCLAAKHLEAKGIIAVDDYEHPRFPEVALAVDRFLSEYTHIKTLLDFNRNASLGRKVYLHRTEL